MTTAEVDVWMDKYDNPMKSLVQEVREAILEADPRVSECIKWQAPTFTYKGNIASFFPKSKQHVSLMFHKGATIPGSFAILEGDAAEGRTFRVENAADLAVKRAELECVIRAWCDMQDAS